ncbi:MAG: DNA (cytosine-5-)-methyltransferase, partial [Candidatus Woesearchaeota archaeon]
NRYRVILIAIRDDINIHYQFPPPVYMDKEELKIGKILEKPFPKNYVEEVWNLSPQALEMTKEIPEGGSWKSVSYEKLPPRLKKFETIW